MIHFFGVLQPSNPRSDGPSEAPFKRRSFGGALFGWLNDTLPLSALERDTMVLNGKAPVGASEARTERFVDIAFPPYI